MTDIEDNPDLASDLSAIAMYVIKSNDPGTHGKLQEAFAAALAPFEDENRRLREALEQIAIQKRTDELVTALDVEFADFEDGYDQCIDCARAALRSTEEG